MYTPIANPIPLVIFFFSVWLFICLFLFIILYFYGLAPYTAHIQYVAESNLFLNKCRYIKNKLASCTWI